VKSWLSSLELWRGLEFGSAPDQLFFWGQQGTPLQTYFAANLPDGSNRVHKAAEPITTKGNAWLATNGMGRLEQPPEGAGLAWTGLPFISPRLAPLVIPEGDFVMCSLAPSANSTLPPPEELIQTINLWTNLVFYEWEITQPRLEAMNYICQVFRLILQKPQLSAESAGLVWLRAAAHKLGNCVTAATVTGPNRISFFRQSNIGFSSIELQLLADWLESPQFPRGCHTLLAPSNLRSNNKAASRSAEPENP
jgi:hypothetical protein